MSNELVSLFWRNFPFLDVAQSDGSVASMLNRKDSKIIERRSDDGKLIGASVVNGSTILMLCVDHAYRNRGIGSSLLAESEKYVRDSGFHEINAGVGSCGYLMPGVPTSTRYFDSVNEKLDPRLDSSGSDFFTAHGYRHASDGNIFDMRFELSDFSGCEHSIGDTIDGLTYRWATDADRERVYACTDDALEEFTQWYQGDYMYDPDDPSVLIAVDSDRDNTVAGALIVSTDTDSGLGTVGCTSVRNAYRGRKIATNLVTLGTRHLRDAGMKNAFLSYTYTGLDKLYGSAGYLINVYYMMARKTLD